MPVFEENTHFQLPGLGSKEKDTPGSFREGTPLHKINGDPDPEETEVSRELTDIKDAQKKVEVSNMAASMAKAIANKNKADLNKHLENADFPVQDSIGRTHQEREQLERDRDLALTGSEFIMEGGMGAAGGIAGALRALKNKQR